MNNKNLIILAALGFYAFSTMKKKEPFFKLPNGKLVKEAELPGYGYVKYRGIWLSADFLNRKLAQQVNGSKSGNWWQTALNTGVYVLNNGKNIWNAVEELVGSFNSGSTADVLPTDIYQGGSTNDYSDYA